MTAEWYFDAWDLTCIPQRALFALIGRHLRRVEPALAIVHPVDAYTVELVRSISGLAECFAGDHADRLTIGVRAQSLAPSARRVVKRLSSLEQRERRGDRHTKCVDEIRDIVQAAASVVSALCLACPTSWIRLEQLRCSPLAYIGHCGEFLAHLAAVQRLANGIQDAASLLTWVRHGDAHALAMDDLMILWHKEPATAVLLGDPVDASDSGPLGPIWSSNGAPSWYTDGLRVIGRVTATKMVTF